MRIALLEDDHATAQVMELWLGSADHKVHHFSTGNALINSLQRDSYDLLILDWMLPDMNGDEVLRWVREHVGWKVPVIFITSRDSKKDIASGLSKGADDYMTKPVSHSELIARIEAVARRFNLSNEQQVIEHAPFRVDMKSRTITRDGEAVSLTQKEFDLAVFLFRNVGRLLSRDHILESVWGRSPSVTTRTVDIHVSRLRKKLKLTEDEGWRLAAVYHQGYRLEDLTPSDVSSERA